MHYARGMVPKPNSTSQGYTPLPRGPDVPNAIKLAVGVLMGRERHPLIASLFSYRVQYVTVKHWMAGRRHAPVWAYEVLAVQLEHRAARFVELAGYVRRAAETEAGKGKGSHGNILRWNRIRAERKLAAEIAKR